MASGDNAVLVMKNFKQPTASGKYHRLTCMTGEDKGTCYYLKSQRIVMGRGDKCDIRVMDGKSSREHVELTRVADEYIMTDLGSHNGVIVNDLKVNQHKLENNDKFIIGATVFKYTRLTVEGVAKKPENHSETDDGEKPIDPEVEAKRKKRIMILVLILLFGIFFLFGNEEEATNQQEKTRKAKDVTDSFTAILKKQQNDEDREVKDKIDEVIHRGLREYRERNYFRAIAEFNLALVLSPANSRAQFYLDKTKNKLDEEIEKNFLKARQDVEALKITSAITSYCEIIRLLDSYSEDKRYQEAKENIHVLEEKLGKDKGATDCLQK